VPIEIADYDPHRPVAAAAAAAELRRALPGLFTELEHVGSTSVPGLAAKPVIDLRAAAPALAAVTDREAALLARGYGRLDTGMPGRLFYSRDQDGRRACHLHIGARRHLGDPQRAAPARSPARPSGRRPALRRPQAAAGRAGRTPPPTPGPGPTSSRS
jgi:GrpB-like predicted nucleotidyltransferase (UPF0157 family)